MRAKLSPTPSGATPPFKGGAPEGSTSPSWHVVGSVIVLYLFLNSSLNMLQKWTLGIIGFKCPILITCCHMAFSFAMLFPVMMLEPYRQQHRPTLQKQWRGLVAIGCFLAINIALNNWSLTTITLSLNQVIRYSFLTYAANSLHPSQLRVGFEKMRRVCKLLQIVNSGHHSCPGCGH